MPGDASRGVARVRCSKCSKALRLAGVAENAVRNGDLQRAVEVLAQIQATIAPPARDVELPDEPTAEEARAACLRRMSARDRDRMLALERRSGSSAKVASEPGAGHPESPRGTALSLK